MPAQVRIAAGLYLAIASAKAMLLLALVVIIVLRILSDEGFMRIQIGRAGSSPPVFFLAQRRPAPSSMGTFLLPPSERQGLAIATASIIPHPRDSRLQTQLIAEGLPPLRGCRQSLR
jgi:hypothetical protein